MLLGKHYLFLFPCKTHKKFPSQLDKIGWFPSQEFRALSNPSIQNDRTKATKPGQNRFFSASAITLTSRRMFGRGKGFFFSDLRGSDGNYENGQLHLQLTATSKHISKKLLQDAFSSSPPMLPFDAAIDFSFQCGC